MMHLSDLVTEEAGIANRAFESNEPNGNAVSDHAGGNAVDTRVTHPVGKADEQPEEKHEGCSLFGFISLPCCKVFLTTRWVLVFLCWAATVQGMVVNGFVSVVVSTLERRFGLQSTQSGIIAGCYDIGSMLSVIPISYFGGRLGTSKPRYISVGLVIMGAGSLLFSLPHFLTDRYLPKDTGDILQTDSDTNMELCHHGTVPTAAGNGSCLNHNGSMELFASLSSYRYFFIFGQVLHGVGAAPLITLGTTLLDESVSKINSPMYIAIFQTMFVIGPAIGFILGGHFLTMYIDFNILTAGEAVPITSQSPLWVGAWWVGFVLAWLLAWACAFFVGLYPAVLPGAHKQNQVKDTDGFVSLKELPAAIKALLLNKTYVFINLGAAMDGFSISCLATFMPKFMQYQYGLTSATAAMIVGLIVVPAGGGGTFLGGFITKRFRLSRSGVIRLYMWCQLVTVPMALGFFFTCPNPNFAGVNVDYANHSAAEVGSSFNVTFTQRHGVALNSSCNSGCACSETQFDPVCGTDGAMYYNPCFAGCARGNATSFADCACVADAGNKQQGSAVKQQCDVNCSFMYGFVSMAFVLVLFTFISAMPNVIATLRAVEPVHRSLGLGLGSIITRILGSIPGPILFGLLIDQTCVLWQKRPCDEEAGNCLFFDNYQMGVNLLIVILAVKALAVIFFAIALFFSKRSPIKDDHDD